MRDKKVTAVIFEGGNPSSNIERDMVKLRQAMVRDNVDRFMQVSEVDKVIVATNYPELRDISRSEKVIVDFDEGQFHFGTRLQQIINSYGLEAVFYMGGAAGPLLTVEEMAAFCRQVMLEPGTVLTNNVQSADLVVFSPATAINDLPSLPNDDNPLANMLRNVGLTKVLMPHSTGIHFDIDTPTDMLILSIHPAIGPHTKQALASLNCDTSHLIQAKYCLAMPFTDVILSGRVGAPVITQLNTYIRCRLRIYSEERGMKSLGRADRGMVRSLLGHMLDILGETDFFAYLGSLAQVAFMDTRVIFAHKKLHLSDNDRFYSDLLKPDKISDPWTRRFTQAVLKAPIPVVVGGHSLVAGGMWSIIDTMLYERELRYSPYKLYSMVVPERIADGEYGQILGSIPPEAQAFGVTRNSTPEHRAFTYIRPRLNLKVENGWHLHIAAPIEIIKEMEQKGWELK